MVDPVTAGIALVGAGAGAALSSATSSPSIASAPSAPPPVVEPQGQKPKKQPGLRTLATDQSSSTDTSRQTGKTLIGQ